MRKFFRKMSKQEDPLNEEQTQKEDVLNKDLENQDPNEKNSDENISAKQAEKSEDNWEDKFKDINDKYIRLYSEFDNFRKRSAKERLDLISSASGDLIKELLPILDDFERAIDANKNADDIEAVKEGIILVHTKINKTLANKGLKEIEAKGNDFDAELHEAIAKFPAADESQKGKIIDVVEKGYYLNDKILRFSKVVVGE
jgi:molecular chaperone GrpE